jgi:hypothetical protein
LRRESENIWHLSDGNYGYVAVDLQRAYSALPSEWLTCMAHLLKQHPHLFSLALRTNAFDANASLIVSS